MLAVRLAEERKEKVHSHALSEIPPYYAHHYIKNDNIIHDNVIISEKGAYDIPIRKLERNGVKDTRLKTSVPDVRLKSKNQDMELLVLDGNPKRIKNGFHTSESRLSSKSNSNDEPKSEDANPTEIDVRDDKEDTVNEGNKTWGLLPGKLFSHLKTQLGYKTKANSAKIDVAEDLGDEDEGLPTSLLWRRRHARTLEEGIRRETSTELFNLLNRAQVDAKKTDGKRYVERTLMGLLNALAEEIEDLDIEFNAVKNTPLWRKEVKEVRINFSRLGFKPLRMGGSDKYDLNGEIVQNEKPINASLSLVESADEAFDRIDKDNSGTLDPHEIAQALHMISELETDKDSIEELASHLVSLYDANSDGVVDREEYQKMVDDMAKLRPKDEDADGGNEGPLKKVTKSVQSIKKGLSEKAAQVAAAATRPSAPDFDPNEREMGSIVLSDLNLDLRRLLFGAIPVVKRVTPGGPLILEPFTVTIRGSFTREDVMGSFLLDSGLRLLVARALRVRVRSFRDFMDGAVFFGRSWKMASKSAPVVQVLGLSNVEFVDEKMILTGRARVRTSPDAPVVTNTFKVRTKIGTRKNGQAIRLVEPELAFVFECPQAWESGLGILCERLGMPAPKRPEPYYSFFPIYSPFKVNDENAGFDMGEDNRLRKIFVKDGKLRFEMRSVLRPGRFLGNHYLAFTLPMRTFIITLDRVKEGIRAARKNKKIAAREKELESQAVVTRAYSISRALTSVRKFASRRRPVTFKWRRIPSKPKPKSFFTRFVEGYTLLEREGEAKNERLANEISDWFARQGSNTTFTEDFTPEV